MLMRFPIDGLSQQTLFRARRFERILDFPPLLVTGGRVRMHRSLFKH
jgi:hypothetical protein